MRKEIPIIMATNDKYVPYLGVAVQSLIVNKSDDYYYHIHIMTSEISDSHISKISMLEEENVKINIINVKELIDQWDIGTVKHLSRETAYRLLVDRLFTQYRKILYLDSDIVINRDVAELYNIDIGDNILGASLATVFEGSAEYVQNDLKVNLGNYFNAGVILINVDEFAKNDIGNRGLRMLSQRPYLCQDQDVLNILCEGKVERFDGRWNVEWQYLTQTAGEVIVDEARKDMFSYINNPFIVHYTSHMKPWNHPEIILAEYFWKYARHSIFYEEVLYQRSLELDENQSNIWSYYLFPWSEIPAKSKLIIYAYGNVGKIFTKQIEKTGYCDVIAICDQGIYEMDDNHKHIPLIKINALNSFEYDYILIAIEKKEVANAVRKNLEDKNIDGAKIVWVNPVREDKR